MSFAIKTTVPKLKLSSNIAKFRSSIISHSTDKSFSKFCIGHGSGTVVSCAKFQSDLTIEKLIIDRRWWGSGVSYIVIAHSPYGMLSTWWERFHLMVHHVIGWPKLVMYAHISSILKSCVLEIYCNTHQLTIHAMFCVCLSIIYEHYIIHL